MARHGQHENGRGHYTLLHAKQLRPHEEPGERQAVGWSSVVTPWAAFLPGIEDGRGRTADGIALGRAEERQRAVALCLRDQRATISWPPYCHR